MPKKKDKEVSRRGFLKHLTGGFVRDNLESLAEDAADDAASHPPLVRGPGPTPITLRINGQRHELHLEPHRTLLEVLRSHLRLTGAKHACDTGECGACTVLLDGAPACACLVLAVEAEQYEITTIEGLATAQGLHPLQQAFIDQDALQCGFCVPGQILSLKALTDRHAQPSVEDIQEVLAAHYCRCGNTAAAVRAVRALPPREPDPS